jgi:hypothetical protein
MRVLGRRKPDLKVRVPSTGGSPGKIDVVANVSNVGTAPAVECRVMAELNGIGIVHSSPPFSLGEGELDHWVPFSLERPRHGDLVKALNDATTLYGRRLTVRVRCDGREGSLSGRRTSTTRSATLRATKSSETSGMRGEHQTVKPD